MIPLSGNIHQSLKARIFPFSRSYELDEGVFCKDGEIIYRYEGLEAHFPTADFRLKGVHNLENIMAALAASLLLGCRPEESFICVRDFGALHHRMEFVREVNGVSYYEDSKATNVGSVVKALESFDDITLIAGGKDKGGSYAPLAAAGEGAGAASDPYRRGCRADGCTSLGSLTDTRTGGFDGRGSQACGMRSPLPGGTVLMSPACSSFDMFRDYEERAQRFICCRHGCRVMQPCKPC